MKIIMAKFKIIFDRELCVGALACEWANPLFWKAAKDGKVDLANAKFNEQTRKWELIIDEVDLPKNKEAADACPVDAIIIEKVED